MLRLKNKWLETSCPQNRNHDNEIIIFLKKKILMSTSKNIRRFLQRIDDYLTNHLAVKGWCHASCATYYMLFFVLRITFNVRPCGYGERPELHENCPSYLVLHRVFSAGHHNLMLSKRGQVSEWRTRELSFNCSRLNGMPAASLFGPSF